MNAAQERLRQGDLSSLSYILDAVENAGLHAPTENDRNGTSSPISAELLRLVIKVVAREGAALFKQVVHTTEHPGCVVWFDVLPSANAVTALRILLAVGNLNGTRGELARNELALVGMRRCRGFALDAYYRLDRAQRYYAVNFVNLLTDVLHCAVTDLLLNDVNIRLTVPSAVRAQTGELSPTPTPHVGAPAAPVLNPSPPRVSRRTPPPPPPPQQQQQQQQPVTSPPPRPRVNEAGGRASGSPRPPRQVVSAQPRTSTPLPNVPILTSTEVVSSANGRHRSGRSPHPQRSLVNTPPPGPAGQVPSVAGVGTRNRSGLSGQAARPEVSVMPINGASADVLLPSTATNTRRFRTLPRTASSTPFAQNPLYDPDAPIAENVLLAAQFPTPVVLFSRLHGLGCLPKLPTSRQYEAFLQSAAPPSPTSSSGRGGSAGNRAVVACSRPSSATGAQLPNVLGSSGAGAGVAKARRSSDGSGSQSAPSVSTDRRTSMHAAADDPDYYIFPSDTSATAAAYHRLCREHWLLSRYLDEGLLMGWGCLLSGAIGSTRGIAETEGQPDRPRAKLHVGEEQKMATPAAWFQFSPVTARSSQGKVVQVACGAQTTFVISATGSLFGCGRCDCGQLGLGERCLRYQTTGCQHFRHINIRDGDRVVRVEAGPVTAAALTESNSIYLWGHNTYGQCMKQPDAVRVLNPIRFRTGNVKACGLGCGLTYGCLVFTDGAMGVWGDGRMLGRPVPLDQMQPTLLRDGSLCQRRMCQLKLPAGCPATVLAAGPRHVAVVTKMGQLFTWGTGAYGRLGHNTEMDEVAPRLLEALRPVFVVSVACGTEHTAAVTSAGEVYVFGDNARGQLGVRGRRPRRSPVQLLLPVPALAVSCGAQHTCVLLQSGDVMACGALRTMGCGLGYGGTGGTLVRILHNYLTLSIACGTMHTMALALPRTTALCRVGHSTIQELSRMETVLVRNGVRAVASGVGFLHVLSENGKLLALGRGEKGQTGLGDAMKPVEAGEITVVSSFQRVALPDKATVIEHVCCGPDYVLALDRSGGVYGWGSNESAQLGLDPVTTPCLYSPAKLSCYTGRVITQLACGGAFVVALTEDCEVLAHGARAYCGLGGSSSEDDPLAEPNQGKPLSAAAPTAAPLAASSFVLVPTEINSLRGVTAIAAGNEHAAALTVSGLVYVWGKGALGTCPGAASVTAYVPTKVLLSCTVRHLGCGPRNTFVISDEGELYVWGCNRHRQCGTRSDTAASPLATTAATATTPTTADGTAKATALESAVTTPVRVLGGVRDAAFTSRFALVALESGEVRVAGRLRHQGAELRLATFAADPQPKLSVTLNGRPRHGHRHTSPSTVESASPPLTPTFANLRPPSSPERSSDDDEHTMISSGEDSFNLETLAPSTDVAPSAAREALTTTTTNTPAPVRLAHAPRGRRSTFASDQDIIFTALTTSAAEPGMYMESPSAAAQGRTGLLIRRTVNANDESAGPTEADDSALAGRTTPAAAANVKATLVKKDGTAPVVDSPPSHAMKRRADQSAQETHKSADTTSSATTPPLHALRAFGGWEQIFAVVETDRPSTKDVQRTHRGLQVYITPAS